MSKPENTDRSINFPNLLTLAFIILKLTHVIDWSWWGVLAPSLIMLGWLAVILTIRAFAKR